MSFDSNKKAINEMEIPNKNYSTDVDRTFQHTRWLLRILGVWPMLSKNTKKWEIYLSNIMLIICWSIMSIFMVPGSLYVLFIEKDVIAKLRLILPLSFSYTNTIKYCSIILHREMIKRCIDHVEFDWTQIQSKTDHEIMSRNVNVGRRLTLVCATFMYTGGLSYQAIMPLWRGTEKNEFNETLWPLIYPFYNGFVDARRTPYFQIIFCGSCLWACIGFTITTAACNLAATFVAHTCGQVEIIMSHLDKLFDSVDETNEIVKSRLGFVVKSHVRMLRLTTVIEILFREICLSEVLASILMICLIEYCCLMEWENSDTFAIITYIELFLSMTFNIFIFCHIGEILKAQCHQVGKAAYMMNWYRLPGKIGLTIIMVMAMSNSPRKMTAGRMIELSMSSFGAIIRTSVAYLNMLRTMTD